MKTTIILLLSTLLFVSSSGAAIIQCNYQETACNDKNDHYACTLFAWGSAQFCSDIDRTNKPNNAQTFSWPELDECIRRCMAQPNANPVLCEIYACGAW